MPVIGAPLDTPTDRRTVTSLLSRLRSPLGQNSPHPVWAEIRALGDVVPAPWGGYFVTGFDVCNQVLRGRDWLAPDFAWQERQPNPERWQSPATREMSRTLSRLNAPAHTCQRRALGNLFDRETLAAMAPAVTAHVTELLDDLAAELAEHGEADVVSLVSDRLPVRTVGGWLGLPREDHDRILDFTHRQVYAQELLPNKSQLTVSAQATLEMREYFTELLRERRARPGDDAISGWIRHWDERSPGDRAAVDQILYDLTMFITIASLETTSTLLTNTVWLLARHPEQAALLRERPESADAFIDEVLRYDPPIHLNTRVASRDTVLAGVPVARDEMVHVLYGAANHDPRRNENPHSFDPSRKGGHLTFGGGAHYCLGAGLARLEARALLTGLMKRSDDLRLVDGPVYAPRMVFRRVTSLKVTT
ncbi:cytochrome P450 [Streptomyces sp. NPDC090306]|uniref:cytochrome P450 n=1 Tax=unclassified Streptomyces TaxID=2593676 RepID=UPI0036E1F3F6